MIRFLFYILILFIIIQGQAQTVQVLEDETGLPIERVLIYDKTKSIFVYTDIDGKANIDIFTKKGRLTFQHISFISKAIFKNKIGDTVYLENNSEQIEEVVLSASRSKEKRERVAEHIEVINQSGIQEISPQTSADLLAVTPGVKVQKSQFGGGSPVMRGMEANRVLLVVDGVRMNNAIYRKGHLQNSISVSPNLLARTEVLFGPSSIIYGSDALGGVIHYYTKKPIYSEGKMFNSALNSRYSTVNNEITTNYTAEFSNRKWASLTGVSVNKFGDLKMGKRRVHGFEEWGFTPYYSRNTNSQFYENPTKNDDTNVQKNTGFSQIDLLQKIIFSLTKKADLSFNLQFSSSTNIPRFDNLNQYDDGALKYAEWYYGPQKRFLAASQLQLNPESKWMEDGTLTFAYQDISESRNTRKFGSLEKAFRDENVRVFSLNGDFHVPLVAKEKRILSYGFEAAFNKVKSKAIGKEISFSGNTITGFSNEFAIQSRYPDGGSSYSNFAAYTNYRLDHNKTGTLNIGARFTHTLLKAKWLDNTFITLSDMDISLNNSALSATLGYVYKIRKKWHLNAVLSSGFRSPNIDDIGKVREKKGKVNVPNIYLKPEYAYNAEVGVIHYSYTRKSAIGFTAYYMLLHHYIERNKFKLDGQDQILYDGEWVDTYANVNKGNAYVVGGTFYAKSKILTPNLKGKTSITYTKGQSLDTNKPLSSIPPLFGDASLTYHKKKIEVGFELRFNAHKKTSLYNLEEGIDNIDESPIVNPEAGDDREKYYGSPAWQTENIIAQYKLKSNTTFILRVDNIFDRHYKEFASGISAPGRNFSISLNTHF